MTASNYITLSEAKEWLGIASTDTTKDTIVTDLIATVSESIDSWTESRFDGPIVVLKEIQDARRQDILLPKGWPLISVQSVRLNTNTDGTGGVEIPATEYDHDDVEIRLRSTQVPQQRAYIALDYTWGYAAVPARVKQATKIGVEGWYRGRARQSVGVTTKAKEGESISFKGAWNGEAGLPIEAVSLLAAFRRIEWPDGAGGQMATRNT